ncbi:hypothetical protein OF83DRAFT_462583 [Amylostereum chailletii]|nr:hypothetical protein OF83DRAFT_462583 [Amylostereum chailletii]
MQSIGHECEGEGERERGDKSGDVRGPPYRAAPFAVEIQSDELGARTRDCGVKPTVTKVGGRIDGGNRERAMIGEGDLPGASVQEAVAVQEPFCTPPHSPHRLPRSGHRVLCPAPDPLPYSVQAPLDLANPGLGVDSPHTSRASARSLAQRAHAITTTPKFRTPCIPVEMPATRTYERVDVTRDHRRWARPFTFRAHNPMHCTDTLEEDTNTRYNSKQTNTSLQWIGPKHVRGTIINARRLGEGVESDGTIQGWSDLVRNGLEGDGKGGGG